MTEVTVPSALLAVDDALAQVAATIVALEPEQVSLADARGRYLAQDLHALLALPPFTNSAMDGYAVRAADTPGPLSVVGESAAGAPSETRLEPRQAIRISTGAALPAGADAVAPLESVITSATGIALQTRLSPGSFVRERGSDIGEGELLLAQHARLGPAQIGAAAAAGLDTLWCRRRPRVAVLTTGSELRPPGEPLRHGEIYDANQAMLHAALRDAGAEVSVISSPADTPEAALSALGRALDHDVVITSGGVSVGDHDLVRDAAAKLGVHELFWRIALRPGKPLSFGVRDRTLVFGLPGNPVSTLVCFELFVAPALRALQGAADCRPAFASGVLATAIARNPVRDDLTRVRRVGPAPGLDPAPGPPLLEPLRGQESHQIAVTAQADGLARIPSGAGALPPGAVVDYLPLNAGAA